MSFEANAGTNSNQEFSSSLMNQQNTANQAGQGAADYGTLFNQGQTQNNMYQGLLQNYLQQFGNAAGINSGIVKAQPGVGLGGNGGAQGNPYGMNPNQQTYVNSQVDALQQARQNALQAYQGHLGAQGAIDPALAAEGAAQINQHFSGLVNQTQAGAQNQIQQENVQNLGNLLNLTSSEAQQGAQQEEAGAGGTLAAGGLYNSAAGTALQGSSQQAQLAIQDAATNPLGSILGYVGNLVGPALGGAASTWLTGALSPGSGGTLSNPSNPNDWNTKSASNSLMNAHMVPTASSAWDPSLMDPNALSTTMPGGLLG